MRLKVLAVNDPQKIIGRLETGKGMHKREREKRQGTRSSVQALKHLMHRSSFASKYLLLGCTANHAVMSEISKYRFERKCLNLSDAQNGCAVGAPNRVLSFIRQLFTERE